jgi:hypothetical protein
MTDKYVFKGTSVSDLIECSMGSDSVEVQSDVLERLEVRLRQLVQQSLQV